MGLYLLHGRLLCLVEGMDFSKPITKQERHLIIRLARPRRIGDVAREMAALPSSLTALADGLCEKGLLVRRRDPTDKRAHLIELTDEGEVMRVRLAHEAQDVFTEEAGLSETDAAHFVDLLRKVRAHIRNTQNNQEMRSCE